MKIDELTVERLNVVEPDGKPRVIISNRPRFPGIYMNGKEYRHPWRETDEAPRGGFLFFNDDGDEVGGYLFHSALKDGHQTASTMLTFDQFKQDQIMALNYNETDGKRNAGLELWDQPEGSMQPLLVKVDKAARATAKDERDAIMKEVHEDGQKQGRFGERFFAGKSGPDSVVKLFDKAGNPRLVMTVTDVGEASLEFRDPQGKAVKRITP